MPLPSLLKGAKQCQVIARHTKQRCKNPAAFGCTACRMHGAHKSRKVLRGKNHPQYKDGGRTKEAEAEHNRASIALLTLRDIGDHLNMFNGTYTRGRKPNGYKKYDLNNPEELVLALQAIAKKKT
jgi:hypothetical protein